MANEDGKVQLINEVLNNLTKFQYEKAKASLDKSKDISGKIWSLFQNFFTHLINGEKFYNNLQFLNQKTISKIGDKAYEPAITCLQNARESSSKLDEIAEYRILTSSDSISISSINHLQQQQHQSSLEFASINEFIEQLIQFIEFRFQMMQFYFEMKERENRPDRSNLLVSLQQIHEIESNQLFSHALMEPLMNIRTLELSLIKNLLECHLAIEIELDCIKSIVCLKEINDIFSNRLPLLNSKQSKESKGFSLFSRSSSQQRLMPILYQWFKMYYQILLNKFSIVMHDSFQMISDVDHIMIEKIELYNKLLIFIKKFMPSLIGLVLDSNKTPLKNFRGAGYEMIFSNQKSNNLNVVFFYPNDHLVLEKHSKILTYLATSEFDQRLKYYFDQNLKSSYYVCKTGKQADPFTFFMIFEQNKQENKTKTYSFVQEICDDLNTNKIFDIFNSNLK